LAERHRSPLRGGPARLEGWMLREQAWLGPGAAKSGVGRSKECCWRDG
jgi:hypothetical protein